MCSNASSACACEVLAARPEGLPPAALSDLLRRTGRVSSQADALRARVIAEAERTHAAEKEGFRSTSEWLAAMSGEPVPVARRQVAVAAALEQMPATREAFGAGEVSEAKVRLLAEAQALAPEQFRKDEARLVAAVGKASPQQVPQVLAAWKRLAEPQGAEAEAERLYKMRSLHVSRGWSDMIHLSGELDPEGGLVVLNAIRNLAEAANRDPADPRTPAQCRADALVEICCRHLDGNGKGRTHPSPVLVTIPWNTLQEGTGLVDTEAGPITAKTARRITCDATISRVLLDPDSVPVEMGRATRVIPPSLRRALELRDQHCTHPGCRIPARWCDAHHIIHWAQGGRTDLVNLQLLCRQHHRDTHQHQPYPRRQ